MKSTAPIRRVAATLLVVAAGAIGAPVAAGSGAPPDAFERALVNAPAASPAVTVDDYFRDPVSTYPDDRAVRGGHPVAGSAVLASQPASGPDAFARAVAAGPAAYLESVSPAASGDGFDWGAFGIGLGTMAGALFLLAGLTVGALAARQARRVRLGRG